MREVVGAASVTALALSGLAVAAPAQAADELPILGQVKAVSMDVTPETTKDVLISVHGVRRVDGGTMVYYSAGLTPGSTQGTKNNELIRAFGFDSTISPRHQDAQEMGDVAILDVPGQKAYTTMYTGDYTQTLETDCLCQRWVKALPSEPEPGKAYAATALLPPIPDDLDTATVRVLGHFFPEVPIQDDAMKPVVPADGPIPVGMGWPKIESDAVNAVEDPTDFVVPLTTHEVIEDSAISERNDANSRSLDLSADVLFAVDKATLTGKAKKEIKAAAKTIKDAEVTGTITVTGHTDSDGAANYNQDLSERRAQSVAKALEPQLPSGVTLRTSGKGESEPITSNDTEDGKAVNRRVTITLPENQ